MNTDAIELSVSAIEPSATVEQIADTYTRVEALKRRTREVEAELKSRLIAWIQENGPITYAIDDKGHTRKMWAAHDKTVKCPDVRKALQAIVEVEGDWDAAACCLSSSAIKHGAAKKYLTSKGLLATYDNLFVTEVKATLKTGEAAPLELQVFDDTFVR